MEKLALQELEAWIGPLVKGSSVAQSCPTLWNPMNRSTPGLPVHHQLPEYTQSHIHWVGGAIQPSHPLLSPLLLPSIFPSSRVFSNESVLRIRWPKYRSFSFSTSSSNEYSGLISFTWVLVSPYIHIFKPYSPVLRVLGGGAFGK